MAIDPGKRLGPFEIVGLLGVGGMGEVYRARDTKLGREVAIKVLPEAFASNPERLARFEREAKLLASLSHPNIAALYEFRHENETHYLVMELVEGDTLADRIKRAPLTSREALPIFTQIARALEAAHERDVIHRDLKPANIKIAPDGTVKVLDFGMAKTYEPARRSSPSDTTLVAEDAPTKVTTDGAILGTPSYMSPEQARGLDVDKRTDVWGFGCCAYEALTGKMPFAGATVSDTLVAVLERDPDWDALPDDLPPHLRSLIRRCLDKEAGHRLRDMRDIAFALEDASIERRHGSQISRAEPAQREGAPDHSYDSLVVLPFDNLMGDPEQEYFVDGMTEALTMELARIKSLTVISRTSAMQFRGVIKPMHEIADELGVDALVEGSVMRVGNNVRITAQLIDGRSDAHLWADRYDGTLDNILSLQGEVALAIAHEVNAALTPDEETRLSTRKKINVEAYEAFLRGRYFSEKLTAEGFQRAIGYFEQALEIDPEFALAYAGLSAMYTDLVGFGVSATDEIIAKARETTDKAIALDDTLSEAHAARAWIAIAYDWDWDLAERELTRAVELEPDNTYSRMYKAVYLSLVGRSEEAVKESTIAMALDPFSQYIAGTHAAVLLSTGEYQQSISLSKGTLELDPNLIPSKIALAIAYLQVGDYDAAIQTLNEVLELSVRDPFTLSVLGSALARAEKTSKPRRLSKSFLKCRKRRYTPRPLSQAFTATSATATPPSSTWGAHWTRANGL